MKGSVAKFPNGENAAPETRCLIYSTNHFVEIDSHNRLVFATQYIALVARNIISIAQNQFVTYCLENASKRFVRILFARMAMRAFYGFFNK
ncbi:MAG: hypothetical protein ACJAVI_000529 [Candidatus Azotimanducaceae bacterium]|jgi:hypothetical protein